MTHRVRVFIDFWNYQLAWNQHTGHAKCDWPRIPSLFVARAHAVLAAVGIADTLRLEETRVYASYNPGRASDTGLRDWLSNFLDRQASFRVFAAERKDKTAEYYCRECRGTFRECPSCHKPLVRSREKGVDTAIVTDLLSLAWEGAYDVAVLVSSDADMVPCVQRVQEKGIKVVNATWPRSGMELAKSCWASFDILDVVEDLRRAPQG